MKIMNPTAMNRYNALREAAGKIDRLVPQVRLLDQPPHENRENASVALEFPTPLVVLNSTIWAPITLHALINALSFGLLQLNF